MTDYKKLLKAIRPFLDNGSDLKGVDLRFSEKNLATKLTRSQKARISKAASDVKRTKGTNVYFHRTRTPKNKRLLQKIGVHTRTNNDLGGAFVPSSSEEKGPRVRYTKRGPIFSDNHVSWEFLPFNMKGLIDNPGAEINRVLQNRKFRAYAIKTGEYQTHIPRGREGIEREVNILMTRYQPGGEKYKEGDGGSNNFNQWLFGLVGYNFHNQSSLKKYVERARVIRSRKQRTRKRK